MTTKTTNSNKKPEVYKNSLGKEFSKKGDTIDLRNISSPLLDGHEKGREHIRNQIGTWFAKKRAYLAHGDVMPISQDQVDKSIEAFLKKGGVIKKLEPGIARMVDEDFSEEMEEGNDKLSSDLSIEKLLTMKINEMRY